ncbi:MAG: TRAP transporter large permease subunit [Ramlibacter sp.]|nr:TRAP transporter large permease subunit [Ramlibacter sp.]
MNSAGLWMLLMLGGLVIGTGLPVWALLLGTSTLFAGLGLVTGQIDVRLLGAVPARLVGLLEHDLLQALPLYVFIGLLLQRLTLAHAIFALLARLLRPLGSSTPLAALGVGVLVAPMNGSVASSASLLSRLVGPRLQSLPPQRGIAMLSVAATIGVVVPPSLVLLLLGDAMLRAHTEASNLPGFPLAGLRIINTQDVLRAALIPALALVVLWAGVAWWRGRGTQDAPAAPLARRDTVLALVGIGTIIALLASVFSGALLAVEAAATGGCLLVLTAVLRRAMSATDWRRLLDETLQLSGALFALLVGATTFSLVFRGWGTDRWLSDLVLTSPLGPYATAAAVLLFVAACAWVLDAFEMIFVIIPILAPSLIARLGDAQQSAVLLLLVLQLGFLLPPMGYAVLVVQSRGGFARVRTAALIRAMLPYALAQVAVLVTVFCLPATVHWLDRPASPAAPAATPQSEADVVKQMEEMARQPDGASEPEPPRQ